MKIKSFPDKKIDVLMLSGTNSFQKVVLKRKIIMDDNDEELFDIYYNPDTPVQEVYTLSIDLDYYKNDFFVEGMKLFFSETKGEFRVVAKERLKVYDEVLVDKLGFKYESGLYTFDSI